jgi:hypothetical protein
MMRSLHPSLSGKKSVAVDAFYGLPVSDLWLRKCKRNFTNFIEANNAVRRGKLPFFVFHVDGNNIMAQVFPTLLFRIFKWNKKHQGIVNFGQFAYISTKSGSCYLNLYRNLLNS